MLGVVPELVGVEGAGSEMETGSGVGIEAGTEVLHNLVSSEEDTRDGTRREVTRDGTRREVTRDGTRREVTEPQ